MASKKKISEADRRRQDFIAYYQSLVEQKEHGVQKFTHSLCVIKAARKFYYENNTAELYVSKFSKK